MRNEFLAKFRHGSVILLWIEPQSNYNLFVLFTCQERHLLQIHSMKNENILQKLPCKKCIKK